MIRRTLIPWIVLAVSLLLTALASYGLAESAAERDRERFDNAVQITRDRIQARMDLYVSLLRSGAALFSAGAGPITRDVFHAYVARIDLQRRYPGIQGIGYTHRFPAAHTDSLIVAMRRQGVDGFMPWPTVPDVDRHAIVYLEPLDRRNRQALGYNMFSEPVRREAMTRARDTGTSAMTGRVTLVQEITTEKQAGFLIYTPVYRQGRAPATVAQRRAALHGFVYAPFRADDLFAGIFGTERRPRVAFRIYDGLRPDDAALLHDSRVHGIAPADEAVFADTVRIAVAGRTWTLSFVTTPFFDAGSRRTFVWLLSLAGVAVSLLLFALSRSQFQAEEAVRGSERRLRAVLESLPVGVFVADATGQVTFSNTAARRIWGGGEHVGLDRYGEYRGFWADTGRPLDASEWALARALHGESVSGDIVDIVAFDGARRTILNGAFPLHGPDGRVEMAVAAVVDITEQRRAEAALAEREREFRSMVDAIPQLAWITDPEGHITWYNRRWYEYTGLSFDTTGGDGWRHVHHPDHLARVTERYRAQIERGESWEDTFPLRGADGRYRWFLSRAVPLRDDEGRIVRWFGTNTDITDQQAARENEARAIREQAAREAAEDREQQLRVHTAELERSNRELQDFAYIASHDLQEPLRKISAFADLLRLEYAEGLDEQAHHYLDRMQQAALRMANLIRDLLAFSRVTTRARPFEPVDLNAALADVLSDLEVPLTETGARVDAGALPTIEADPLQMRQLLQNLVGNALKFHRPGVTPHVAVRATVADAPDPYATGTRAVCRIEVADNGIGFDEKYLDRIFTPFQRLHSKDRYQGTGIGLAICRRIAERHGGTITGRSTPGEGATFIVELPLRPPIPTAP